MARSQSRVRSAECRSQPSWNLQPGRRGVDVDVRETILEGEYADIRCRRDAPEPPTHTHGLKHVRAGIGKRVVPTPHPHERAFPDGLSEHPARGSGRLQLCRLENRSIGAGEILRPVHALSVRACAARRGPHETSRGGVRARVTWGGLFVTRHPTCLVQEIEARRAHPSHWSGAGAYKRDGSPELRTHPGGTRRGREQADASGGDGEGGSKRMLREETAGGAETGRETREARDRRAVTGLRVRGWSG